MLYHRFVRYCDFTEGEVNELICFTVDVAPHSFREAFGGHVWGQWVSVSVYSGESDRHKSPHSSDLSPRVRLGGRNPGCVRWALHGGTRDSSRYPTFRCKHQILHLTVNISSPSHCKHQILLGKHWKLAKFTSKLKIVIRNFVHCNFFLRLHFLLCNFGVGIFLWIGMINHTHKDCNLSH